VYIWRRFQLAGLSGMPPVYPATTFTSAKGPAALGLFNNVVNALTCEVVVPMIPAFSGSPARQATAAVTTSTRSRLKPIKRQGMAFSRPIGFRCPGHRLKCK